MLGKWIWLSDGQRTENERGCFVAAVEAPEVVESCRVRITAVHKYALFLNGICIGQGPVRTTRETAYADAYELAPALLPGGNHLAIEVWNQGYSTYQSLHDASGLVFDVHLDGRLVLCSDETVRCHRDLGHRCYAPKRNVNLGFTDYYDARLFSQQWMRQPEISAGWPAAAVCPDVKREIRERPIRAMHGADLFARRVVRVEDARDGCQVITVNTRKSFFGDRLDADETNFNGLLGCVLHAPQSVSGRVAFPNRTWNGLLGTFRIGGTVYPVSDRHRDISVEIPAGDSLFLMQLSGKFDDLYAHIEFPREISLKGFGTDGCCFTIGPTARRISGLDGRGTLYGDMGSLTDEDIRWFDCETLDQLRDSGAELHWVPKEYVMRDEYLLSLSRRAEVTKTYAVEDKHTGLLWDNDQCTVIDVPRDGDCRRITLDFGDIVIGNLSFNLYAQEGTEIDFYGYENEYRGEVDYTIGLNNGMRYICRQGWQSYRCMARLGFRYLVVTVRKAAAPVRIRDLRIRHSVHAAANTGSFACDDEKLNTIWRMSEHTLSVNQEDVFTDSPTYEQAFWIGDAQSSAAVSAYVYGDYAFIRNSIVMAATASANTPLYNALTPTDWGTSIPMWTLNWLVSILEYIETTADETIIDELYLQLRQVLDYYHSLLTPEGGFLVSAWNLIDWAALDVPDYCIPAAYQGQLSYCFDRFSAFARRLGNHEDADRWLAAARTMRGFLDRELWNAERNAFADAWIPGRGLSATFSLQTHVLLWLYGAVVDAGKKEYLRRYILSRPDDFLDAGSPFILSYLYEAQAGLGVCDALLEDIKARWGAMLLYETTTCWEVFPGFYENSRTRSYCHAWSTAPAALMQKILLGVVREFDGYGSIRIAMPDTKLRWCRGCIPTPHGPIEVDWNKDIKAFSLRLPADIALLGGLPEGFDVQIERTGRDE